MNLQTLQKNPKFLDVWKLARPSHISEMMDGAVNRVFKIHTLEANYYLRVYKTKDSVVIQREHHLIHHVCGSQVPAARPLPTIDGASYIQFEDRYCALYTEAQGQQIKRQDLTTSQARSCGAMLAKIHKATQDLPNVGYRVYGLKWNAVEWIQKLDTIEELIEKRDQSESDQWALSRLRAQRDWLKSASCPHSYATKYPSQVLHGDYHDGNLFFEGNEVSGVIDWDQAVFMPKAFEVVRAVSYMFPLSAETAFSFVKAYLEINPMDFAELEDGALAWGAHSDHYVWAVEETYLNGNERARNFIPHRDFKPFEKAWSVLRTRLMQEIYFL